MSAKRADINDMITLSVHHSDRKFTTFKKHLLNFSVDKDV
jgi:hypothetical protein